MNNFKFLLPIIWLLLMSIGSYAQKTKSEDITVRNKKKFYIHNIVQGQSLSVIAKLYHVSVNEIKEANDLKDDFVREGEKLLVPFVESGDKPIDQPIKTENKQSLGKEVNKDFIVYLPKEGETLYGLSQKFQVTIREILELNGGENGPLKSGLKANEAVKIPVSQETRASIEQLTKDSVRGYFLYTVQKSETLYGIAWRYETTVDMIMLFNPGITPMIEDGQLLKVPLKNTSVNYTIHKVDKKTTISKLAKAYNLEDYELKAINPGLMDELKVGQQVKIPVKTEVETVKVEDRTKEKEKVKEKDNEEPGNPDAVAPVVNRDAPVEVVSLLTSDCKKINANAEIQVALMVPFYLEEQDTTGASESVGGNLNSFSFIHFYEGCLIAIDSLEKSGVKAKVHVFDVTDDESNTRRLLKNPELKKMDLIVGPFLGKSFNMVTEFAKSNSIPIVNPLSFREEVIKDHPNVFKVKPGQSSQFPQLVEFIDRTYPESLIFVLRENKNRDIQAFEELHVNLITGLKEVPSDNIRFINNGKDSLRFLPDMYSGTKTNLVIVYTENKAFALDCIRKLSENKGNKDVRVIGMPRWDRFQFTEIDYLVDLKVHYFSPSFIDYTDKNTNRFIKSFKNKFGAEPEQYAYEGFDILWFFMSALSKYGDQCDQCISVHKVDLLQNQFRLKKTGNDGWENQYWNFIKYADFRLIRATRFSKFFD